jgi:glycosyltransferase involved in cell wall biosynthesis
MTPSSPAVDFIIPVYNAAEFLGAALESVLAQGYEPVRIIVVDDGSTDESAAVAEASPGVLVIRQENQGPAAARNTGLAAAEAPYIALHDADDLLPPNKLRIQIGYLEEHPEVACVLGRQQWIDPPPWLPRDMLYGELGGIPLPSAVFRAAVLNQLGGFDPSFRTGEDMDLLFRLREAGHGIVVLPDVLLYRRYHGTNLSVVTSPENRLRSLRAKLERERKERRAEA